MQKQCAQILSFDGTLGCIFNFYLLVFSVLEVTIYLYIWYVLFTVQCSVRECFLVLPS